jgi:hypothetical protein
MTNTNAKNYSRLSAFLDISHQAFVFALSATHINIFCKNQGYRDVTIKALGSQRIFFSPILKANPSMLPLGIFDVSYFQCSASAAGK